MFLGHYGVAFALKRTEPRLSLGTLFLAVGLVDLAWGVFLLTGWEQARIVPGLTPVNPIEFLSYPITHSLLGGFVWAALAGAITYTWPTRDTSRHHWIKAAVVAGAVLSHWFLDLIVHLPDLPLTNDASPKYGLGLWKSLPLTLLVESVVFLGGLAIYIQWRSQGNTGRLWRVWLLAGILIALYAASLLGPPPSSMKVIGVMDIIGTILLVTMARWADRREKPVEVESRGHGLPKRAHSKR